jgi:hypothetical protein
LRAAAAPEGALPPPLTLAPLAPFLTGGQSPADVGSTPEAGCGVEPSPNPSPPECVGGGLHLSPAGAAPSAHAGVMQSAHPMGAGSSSSVLPVFLASLCASIVRILHLPRPW